MSKFLGIDYGTKRIGIALSDSGGKLAFPECILTNTEALIEEVKTIIEERGVTEIIIGESKDYKGTENPLMRDIQTFVEQLSKRISVPIYFEPEFLTTQEARRTDVVHKDSIRRSRGQKKNTPTDASAAALILQSFLDKRNQYGSR